MNASHPPQDQTDKLIDSEAEAEEHRKKELRKQRRARLVEEAKQEAIKAIQAQEKQRGGKDSKTSPKVVEIAPIARSAHMRRRHWGLIFSFVLFVLVPMGISGWYLWERAADQYASTAAFTVRQERTGSATDILSGLAGQVAGSSTSSDTAILYEYIQSQRLVSLVDEKFDLQSLYSLHWDQDPVFSLTPEPTLEDLVTYWQRIISVTYDESSGLMELRVLAFDPQTAQDIAQEIILRSQDVINGLNDQARADTIRYAEADLIEAQERVRNARAALTLFRTRTQLVDPQTDLAGRLGVVNTLQQQLAEALVANDLLLLSTTETDPRLQQSRQRIDVIRNRLAEERANVAGGTDAALTGEDYPTLLAEYEGLLVDREFAEESYRAALAAVDVARANADRQSRYLAAFISPTIPQTAEFPQRLTLLGLISLFLLLSWAICALIYYSVRDSR